MFAFCSKTVLFINRHQPLVQSLLLLDILYDGVMIAMSFQFGLSNTGGTHWTRFNVNKFIEKGGILLS